MRWVALVVLSACGSNGSASIRVDLRTDFVPGIEFVDVRTTVAGASETTRETTRVTRDDDVFESSRVAMLDDVAHGNQVVDVALLDDAGEIVARRAVRVRLREDLGVTVLITRDCRGVMCPGAGDDPNALSCLGGRCVPLECTDGASPECPDPECDAASACTAGSSCSSAQCVEGTCVYRRDDAMCDAEQYCEPERGCLDVPTLPDAGMPDGGGTDAAMDGPMPLVVLDVMPKAGPVAGGTTLTFALGGDRTDLLMLVGDTPCSMIDQLAGTCVTLQGASERRTCTSRARAARRPSSTRSRTSPRGTIRSAPPKTTSRRESRWTPVARSTSVAGASETSPGQPRRLRRDAPQAPSRWSSGVVAHHRDQRLRLRARRRGGRRRHDLRRWLHQRRPRRRQPRRYGRVRRCVHTGW